MHRKWLKLWRKTEDSAVFRDSPAFHIFMYLLMNAQYREEKYSTMFEGRQIYLQRGECVIGRHKVARATGIKPSTVRNALERLEKLYSMISTKKDNKRTIVTLLNWDTYQVEDQKEDINRTSRGHQKDTKQEGKKVIRKRKEDIINKHFESLWLRYPNKTSKSKAQSNYLKTVATKEDENDITTALSKYLIHLESHPRQDAQGGPRWFGEWRDWVNFEEPERRETVEERDRRILERLSAPRVPEHPEGKQHSG